MATREQIKGWFQRNDIPLASQFAAWIDSFWHTDDAIPISSIDGLDEVLSSKLNQSDNNEKYDKSGGPIDGLVDLLTERVGNCFRVKDKATGFILLDIDQYGHINSYGTPNTPPYASGAFNVWRNGNLRLQMTTEGGAFVLNMYDNSNNLVMKFHTAGESIFNGGNIVVGNGMTITPQYLLETLIDGKIERDVTTGKLYFTNGTERKELGGFDIATTFDTLETTNKDIVGAINEVYTDKENAGVAAGFITALLDGVSSAGNTLKKLFVLVSGKQDALGFTPENVANKNTANGYAGLDLSQLILVAQLQAIIDDASSSETNKTWSNSKISSAIATAVSNLVASAPSTLDTLKELADALGDDPNYATTISTALGNKVNVSDILNVLTSTATNKPLSANQGYILKGLIDALTTTVSGKVDKVTGKGLSTVDFTDTSYVHTDNNFTSLLKAAYDAAVTNSHAKGSDNQTAATVPVVASGFTKNLNSTITNVQLLANAVDQLSAGSNGIPNPCVYSYTGGIVTKEIETIIGGTIERRYRYYSGGSAQDGSMDIAEIQNSVTGDFNRVTCVYTGGQITSRTLTTITTFSI